MMTEKDLLKWLERCFELGLKKGAVAEALGISRQSFTNMLNRGTISKERMAPIHDWLQKNMAFANPKLATESLHNPLWNPTIARLEALIATLKDPNTTDAGKVQAFVSDVMFLHSQIDTFRKTREQIEQGQ